MGIYINTEMPKDIEPGLVIEFADGIDGKRYARLYHYRHGGLTEWLEAVPVPPYGRLIDADMLPISTAVPLNGKPYRYVHIDNIENAPTIIPTEEAERKMPIIACRGCKEPDCTNCNMYILESALKQGKLKSLMDDKHTIQIENIKTEAEGAWIKMSDNYGIYYACSVCGEDIPRVSRFNPQIDLFPHYESIDKTRYCPSCGVKMKNWAN